MPREQQGSDPVRTRVAPPCPCASVPRGGPGRRLGGGVRSMGLHWEASASLPRWPPPCKTGRSRAHGGPYLWRLLATTFCLDVDRGGGF